MTGDADHDLLLRLHEQLSIWTQLFRDLVDRVDRNNTDLRAKIDTDIAQVWVGIDEIRRDLVSVRQDLARGSGFFSGAKWLWNLILALPAGVVAFMFGRM